MHLNLTVLLAICCQVVGDDLLVTNPKRVAAGIEASGAMHSFSRYAVRGAHGTRGTAAQIDGEQSGAEQNVRHNLVDL